MPASAGSGIKDLQEMSDALRALDVRLISVEQHVEREIKSHEWDTTDHNQINCKLIAIEPVVRNLHDEIGGPN